VSKRYMPALFGVMIDLRSSPDAMNLKQDANIKIKTQETSKREQNRRSHFTSILLFKYDDSAKWSMWEYDFTTSNK